MNLETAVSLVIAMQIVTVSAIFVLIHARIRQVEDYLEDRFNGLYEFLNDIRQYAMHCSLTVTNEVSKSREYVLTPRDIDNDER